MPEKDAGTQLDSFAKLEQLTAKLPLFAVLDRCQGSPNCKRAVEELKVERGTCIKFPLYTYGGLVSVDRFVFCPGTVMGAHIHSGEVQVLFVYLGKATVELDGNKIALQAGESVVIPANVVHNFISDSEVRCISIVYPAGSYSAKGVLP